MYKIKWNIDKLTEKYDIKSFEEKKKEFDNTIQQLGQSVQQLADLISVKAQEYFNPTNSNERHMHTLTENSKMSQFTRLWDQIYKEKFLAWPKGLQRCY